MHEYTEEIPKEKLKTEESAVKALVAFYENLFKALGYDDMEITFHDDYERGVRVVWAQWTEKTDKEDSGDGGDV